MCILQSDRYNSENFDVSADGRKTGKTGLPALLGLISVVLMGLIAAGCAGPVDDMADPVDSTSEQAVTSEQPVTSEQAITSEQATSSEQPVTSEQPVRDYLSLTELDFLEFGTYSLNWIRYQNVDQNGAVKLSSDGAAFFPFFYAVSERSILLQDLENRETLENLVDGRIVLSDVEAIDGFCETTTLAGISTDLFCQLGSKMPEGHFSLVLYDSETLELVALTTTINNVNNATDRFTAELKNKARFADLTAVKELLATAGASVTAAASSPRGDGEPGHTDNNEATPTPTPSTAPALAAAAAQNNTPTATNTPLPSNPPANTPVPPTATNTPVRSNPPANTPVPPTATNTPVRSNPPANTPVPPTATNTPVRSNPPANTPVPPTATNTSAPPTATNTSIPPTATNTSVPPTATNTPVPLPTATPTNTPDVGDVPTDPGEGENVPEKPEPEPKPEEEECTSPFGCDGGNVDE